MRSPSFLCLLPLLFLPFPALDAQTPISGTINTYVSVTATNLPNNAMTVSSVAGFSLGDLVLVIQMQGASITSSPANSSAYGTITSYAGAGSYDLVNICSINGNELTFEQTLVNNDYHVAGHIQIIKVPQYTQVEVTGTLTGQAWDGSTGGIVVLIAHEKLTLSADIDMDAKGFRGGVYQNDNTTSCFGRESDYYYSTEVEGGKKGEGIANYITAKEYGRGAQANGGGGGNDHNSGGGGGGNGGAGGIGGKNDEPKFWLCDGRDPGVGGKSLTTANRLFMGGGGGAGHGNNFNASNGDGGTSGGNGGGLVLLIADTLAVNGSVTITADGVSAAHSRYDGAGGGGAGGSIFLAVNTYSGSNLSLSLTGGNGGNASNDNDNRCYGPGGGGAGGMVKSTSSLPGFISRNLSGGTTGATIFSSANNCDTGGSNGGTGVTAVEALVKSTTNYPFCNLLPVSWGEVGIEPEGMKARLHWSIENAYQHAYFTVERSADFVNFEAIATISAALPRPNAGAFSWVDAQPITGQTSYYRIRQVDMNGAFSFSPVLSLTLESPFTATISPNPLLPNRPLYLTYTLPESGELGIMLMDGVGRKIYANRFKLMAGNGTLELPLKLPKGMYSLQVYAGEAKVTKRLVVVE